MAETYRCFAAVSLSSELREAATRVAQRLRETAHGVTWVAGDRMHATMKFYGDVDATRLSELRVALAESVPAVAPIVVTIRGAGTFPTRKAPRVVWLGLQDEPPGLAALHRVVGKASACCGFPRDKRPFRPHLTLGRVRRRKRDGRRGGPNDQGLDDPGHRLVLALEPFRQRCLGSWTVDTLTLYRSELRPEGPRYTALERYALRGETMPDTSTQLT